MTRQKELASLIQKGLLAENVIESENCFFEDVFGKFGSANKAYDLMEAEKEVYVELESKDLTLTPDYVDIAANLLEIDFNLADANDKTHMLGISAALITERLEQGTSLIRQAKAIEFLSLFICYLSVTIEKCFCLKTTFLKQQTEADYFR